MLKIIRLSFLLILISSCTSLPEEKDFEFMLKEKCMITNLEQNNLIEGTHLRVITCEENTWKISLKLPENFPINSENCSKWMVGWGDRKPYYDAGVENIRWIDKIDEEAGIVFLGDLKRGKGLPRNGQRIVFWNTEPSDYKKEQNKPIVDPSFWPEFNGESVGFGSVVWDPFRKMWIMLVNEVDSDKIQIYAAFSRHLKHWEPANKGKPILTVEDFEGCSWTSKNRTPIVSDIVQDGFKYYVFMDAEDDSGKRHIGMATTDDLLGDYTILKEAILSPQSSGSWNDQSVFCAKVARRKKDFVLFYDGRNEDGYERIGRATSSNLTSWKMDQEPVLDQHVGWRGANFTTEPSYVECHGDTVILMAAGAKKFQESYWHHYVTHRSYMDRSGNVNDAQLGAFISTDGGKTFKPHPNNPVFVNAYSDRFENEHMGGNFEVVNQGRGGKSYIFYQAKSSFSGMKYSIFMRSKSR